MEKIYDTASKCNGPKRLAMVNNIFPVHRYCCLNIYFKKQFYAKQLFQLDFTAGCCWSTKYDFERLTASAWDSDRLSEDGAETNT